MERFIRSFFCARDHLNDKVIVVVFHIFTVSISVLYILPITFLWRPPDTLYMYQKTLPFPNSQEQVRCWLRRASASVGGYFSCLRSASVITASSIRRKPSIYYYSWRLQRALYLYLIPRDEALSSECLGSAADAVQLCYFDVNIFTRSAAGYSHRCKVSVFELSPVCWKWWRKWRVSGWAVATILGVSEV